MPAVTSAATAHRPLIAMHQVSHYFGTDALRRQVLFGVTLSVEPGEIVILTGPSGSGKTTLLTLCGGLRTVQEGSVHILGRELHGAGKSAMGAIRESVGVIFQAHHLLDALTARQNVALALGVGSKLSRVERYRRADAMLEAVGLSDRLSFYPSEMSGGQKQRVAVARALVRRPKIILADEPTASLDRNSGREVIELLHRIAVGQGCAVLLVTHDNRILDIADRIVTLEDGHLMSSGSEVAATAGNMLSVFARLDRKGQLVQHLQSISTKQFLSVLEHMTVEFQQYLRVFEIGSHAEVESLFDTLLSAVTSKTFSVMHAERGSLYVVDSEAGVLRSVLPADEEELPIATSVPGNVVTSGKPVRGGGGHQLCLPVFDHRRNILGVVQLNRRPGSDGFTQEDEQRFYSLAEPIGVLLASFVELHKRSAAGRE